jgi:MFS family permease
LFPAVPLVASCWAAAALAWLVVQLALETESRKEIAGAGIFWGALLSPVVAFILLVFGWSGAGVALMVLLIPVLRDLLALGPPRRLPPAYERALERLKRGEHSAAEMEIIRQLERREDDFEGWMLLAAVYAKNFGDLAEAERTVRELCGQPTITRSQYSAALMQLGEWHLQFHFDAAAARGVWSEICERFPHTEFADVARRRISRLTHG